MVAVLAARELSLGEPGADDRRFWQQPWQQRPWTPVDRAAQFSMRI